MIIGHYNRYTVACDQDGCVSTFGPVGPVSMTEILTSAECDEIRRRARKCGWSSTVRHGRVVDLCPVCGGRAHP